MAEHPHDRFGLSELARHVGLAKPTCLGIVTTLTESGYLVRDSRDKTYRLGPSLIALGHIAQESMRVSPAAREELRRGPAQRERGREERHGEDAATRAGLVQGFAEGVALVAEAFEVHIPKGYLYAPMAFSLGVETLNIRARNKRLAQRAG